MFAEPVDPVLDDLADALRQAAHRHLVDAPAPRGLVEQDRAGLDQVAQDLADEEWVAPGLGRESTRERQTVGIELVARCSGDQLGNLIRSEPAQTDPRHTVAPPQIREHPGQQMVLGQIRVAIGDDQQQRALLYRAGRVLEQRDRLPVGPMEVVEHHAQRLSLHAPQHTANPSACARSAAWDARRVFPIPGSPDRSTARRAPARACARERSISARSSARPT